MNVKCKKCGKIFDAETYSCLCPNCGTWYISVDQFDIQNVDYKNDQWSWNQEDTHDSDPVDGQGNAQENTADLIHDIHESRDEHQEQQEIEKQQEIQDQKESQEQHESQERDININVPKRNSKWAAVLLAIVVSFLVIGTVVAINGGSVRYDYDDDDVDYEEDSESDEELADNSDIVIKYGDVGDQFDVQDIYGDHGVFEIKSIGPAQYDELDIPDGYQLYKVEYTIVKDSDQQPQINSKSDVDALTPVGVRRNNEHTYIDARMRTKTGIIVRPLYTIDMEEMINTDQDIDAFAEENYLDSSLLYSYGNILFMAKEDDYDCLAIYSQVDDRAGNLSLAEIDVIDQKGDADKAGWLLDADDDIQGNDWYIDEDNVYVKKIDEDTVFTPYDSVNMSIKDLLSEDEIEHIGFDGKGKSYYLVVMRITNNMTREYFYPMLQIRDANGHDLLMYEAEYSSEYGNYFIPPKTTATLYCIVTVDDDYEDSITVSYNSVVPMQDRDDDWKEVISEFDIEI